VIAPFSHFGTSSSDAIGARVLAGAALCVVFRPVFAAPVAGPQAAGAGAVPNLQPSAAIVRSPSFLPSPNSPSSPISPPPPSAFADLHWDAARQGRFVMSLAWSGRYFYVGCEDTGVWQYDRQAPEKDRWRQFTTKDGRIEPKTNRAGGILGGISTGAPIISRIAVKPTPSIGMRQTSVDLETLEEVDLSVSGRHDPCILPRIVPVAEAMVAIVLADLMLAGGFIHPARLL